MSQTVRIAAAAILGLCVWAALLRYLWHSAVLAGRKPEAGLDRKPGTEWERIPEAGLAGKPKGKLGHKPGAGEHFAAVIWAAVFTAGILCMSLGYCCARRRGLPYINCLRNELVSMWLLAVALVDGRKRVIPHALTLPGFGAWLVLAVLAVWPGGSSPGRVIAFSLGGCLLGGGIFFLCRMLTKGGVGMGDVRVFSILGLLHGMNDTFSIVFFAILLMTVYGLGAVLARKKNMKSQLPMGPFILASYLLCGLLGV